jgi:hypothetical protein
MATFCSKLQTNDRILKITQRLKVDSEPEELSKLVENTHAGWKIRNGPEVQSCIISV